MYAKVSLMPQTVEKLTTKNGSSYNVLLSILAIYHNTIRVTIFIM